MYQFQITLNGNDSDHSGGQLVYSAQGTRNDTVLRSIEIGYVYVGTGGSYEYQLWLEDPTTSTAGGMDAYLNCQGYYNFDTGVSDVAHGGSAPTNFNSGIVGVLVDTFGNVGIGLTNPSAKLDVNGYIKNQQPSWNLYKLGSSSGAASGTLSFNDNRVSARSCTLNTSGGLTSRVTITVAGRYFIGFKAFTESSVASGSAVEYSVRINGGTYVRNFHRQPITEYSAMGGLGCLADLSVNDYVEIYSGEAVHHSANASFYGFMIG
jgi:hypothetical protein